MIEDIFTSIEKISESDKDFLVNSVSVNPGDIEFTITLLLAPSTAKLLVRPIIPFFETE